MKQVTLAIVGTDTGVGKTLVAAALAAAHAPSKRVRILKPAETGCPPPDLIPQDGSFLLRAAHSPQDLPSAVPYRYALPASPLAASLEAPPPPDLQTILRHAHHLAEEADLLLLEGAGGLLVPFGPDWTFADLLQELRPEVLVVARAGLGTMNHTLLTVEALVARGLHPLAVLLNQTSPTPGPEEPSTPRVLARFLPCPLLGPIPYLPPDTLSSPSAIAAQLRPILGYLPAPWSPPPCFT